MAEPEKMHYNLHSGSEMVKLPVQIQMSDDSAFMKQILQQDQDSDSGKSFDSDY